MQHVCDNGDAMRNLDRTRAAQVGDLIRQLREAEGLSLYKLAIESGVDRSTIMRTERGDFMPTTDVLMRLCEALDVTYTDLAELVGFDAAKTLPEPAIYFRTKYGLPPEATAKLERQFEKIAKKHGIDPNQAGPAEGADE